MMCRRCAILHIDDLTKPEALVELGIDPTDVEELQRFGRYLAQDPATLTDEEYRDRLRYEGIPESRIEQFVAKRKVVPSPLSGPDSRK